MDSVQKRTHAITNHETTELDYDDTQNQIYSDKEYETICEIEEENEQCCVDAEHICNICNIEFECNVQYKYGDYECSVYNLDDESEYLCAKCQEYLKKYYK